MRRWGERWKKRENSPDFLFVFQTQTIARNQRQRGLVSRVLASRAWLWQLGHMVSVPVSATSFVDLEKSLSSSGHLAKVLTSPMEMLEDLACNLALVKLVGVWKWT